MRIEESEMFAVSLALVVAHPQLESSKASYGLCCALSTTTTKKALARVCLGEASEKRREEEEGTENRKQGVCRDCTSAGRLQAGQSRESEIEI